MKSPACRLHGSQPVRAGAGELGIIPGSMGAKSFIVRGKGNAESFETCSDEGVIDETPGAYKDIDAVMAAQADLVENVHTLRQVVCVKG
jgi:tRNA-splicing ligase RtcB (3'-phosphate/5'-hydroxy nucleic acid ligase)